MSAAEELERQRPLPAMPPRPARRLSTLRLLRVAQQNSLAACDEELFDELFVERRFLGRRFYVIGDPEGIRRVLQDNNDNYPRLTWIRRVFEFASGSGMLHAEGAPWRRHRRLINPTMDHRAMLPDGPTLGHIIPDSKGGTDDLANLGLEHRRCNLAAGARANPPRALLANPVSVDGWHEPR